MRPFIGPTTIEGHQTDTIPGRRDYAPEAAGYVDARVLAAATSEAHPIPAGARYVNFTADGNFYARLNAGTGTVAIPAADVIDGTAPVLNPGSRTIPADATHILLIAAQATVVTLEFWS